MIEQKLRGDVDITGIPVSKEEGEILKQLFFQLTKNPKRFYTPRSVENRMQVVDGHVTYLDLAHMMDIEQLPESILGLTNLRRLDVYRTGITETDPVVEQLKARGIDVYLEPPRPSYESQS